MTSPRLIPIRSAGELYQRPVADQLEDAASVRRDSRIEDDFSVALQGGQRPHFIIGHEAGVSDNIRGEDCRESAIGSSLGHTQVVELCHRSRQPRWAGSLRR